MKKCVCFLLLLLMLPLSGCSGVEQFRNDLYVVTKKGDTFYAEVNKDVRAYMFESENIYQVEHPSFSSLEEMVWGIREGNITVPQLDLIYRQSYRTNDLRNGRFPIVDINNLYDACLPSSISDKKVIWTGNAYRFEFQEGTVKGSISVTGKKTYEELVEEYSVSGHFKAGGYTSQDYLIISEAFDPERNATIIVYRSIASDMKKKSVFYSYSDDTKTIIFWEFWGDPNASVPESVRFVGEQGNCYFSGGASGFSEMPSYEWLTSFGMVPYAETEAEQGSTQ